MHKPVLGPDTRSAVDRDQDTATGQPRPSPPLARYAGRAPGHRVRSAGDITVGRVRSDGDAVLFSVLVRSMPRGPRHPHRRAELGPAPVEQIVVRRRDADRGTHALPRESMPIGTVAPSPLVVADILAPSTRILARDHGELGMRSMAPHSNLRAWAAHAAPIAGRLSRCTVADHVAKSARRGRAWARRERVGRSVSSRSAATRERVALQYPRAPLQPGGPDPRRSLRSSSGVTAWPT